MPAFSRTILDLATFEHFALHNLDVTPDGAPPSPRSEQGPKISGAGTLQMKLRAGVEAVEHLGETLETIRKQITTDAPTDILVQLPGVHLVKIQPEPSGWYAVLCLGPQAKRVLDKFSSGIKEFVTKNSADGKRRAFSSPFAAPLEHELQMGAVARVHVKIGEYSRRLLHSNFSSPSKKKMHGVGDAILDFYDANPIGACSVTLHLRGAWYDPTKFGPLFYLLDTHYYSDTPTLEHGMVVAKAIAGIESLESLAQPRAEVDGVKTGSDDDDSMGSDDTMETEEADLAGTDLDLAESTPKMPSYHKQGLAASKKAACADSNQINYARSGARLDLGLDLGAILGGDLNEHLHAARGRTVPPSSPSPLAKHQKTARALFT